MVETAPKWSEILPQVEELLIGKKVCIYDPASEIVALRNSYQNYHHRYVLNDRNFISLMDIFARYRNERDPRSKTLCTYALEDAAKFLGIDIEIIGYRRAREDAWLMVPFWSPLPVGKYIINVRKSTGISKFHPGDGLCGLCSKP